MKKKKIIIEIQDVIDVLDTAFTTNNPLVNKGLIDHALQKLGELIDEIEGDK